MTDNNSYLQLDSYAMVNLHALSYLQLVVSLVSLLIYTTLQNPSNVSFPRDLKYSVFLPETVTWETQIQSVTHSTMVIITVKEK